MSKTEKRRYLIYAVLLLVVTLKSLWPGRTGTAFAATKQTATVPVLVSGSLTTVSAGEYGPWWLESSVTGVGILLGALLVVWQMRRQHRSALEVQRENARHDLHLRVYYDIAEKVEAASESLSHSGMWAYLIATNLGEYGRQARTLGQLPSPIPQRAMEFSRLDGDAQNKIVDVLLVLEKHEIIAPRLRIFRLVFGVSTARLRDAQSALFSALLLRLPMDMPNGVAHVPLPLPTDAEIEALDALAKAYWERSSDIVAYFSDLIVEAQNILLSELFNNRVPVRRPLDNRHVVISTDPQNAQELFAHFRSLSRHPEAIRPEEWLVTKSK